MRFIGLFLLVAALHLVPGQVWAQKTDAKSDTSQFKDIGGRPLEDWIKDIHSKDRSKAETAVRIILMYPADRAYQAVPDLLSELKKHTFTTPLDISLRVNIPMALGIILTNTKGADPKHVTEAVTLLTRLLKDTQSIVRYRAAEALGRIGPEARAATTELIPLLKDPATWEIRQIAALALGQVSYNDKGPPLLVLDALYKSLGDSASQVRLGAIQALTFAGPPELKVKPLLMNALAPLAANDPEPAVLIWANMALISLNDGPNAMWLNPILKLTKHKDPMVRAQALQAVGTIGGAKVKAAVPNLIDSLNDPDSPAGVQMLTMWALGRIGVWGSDAIPSLEKIAADAKQPDPMKKAAQECIDLLQGKKKTKG